MKARQLLVKGWIMDTGRHQTTSWGAKTNYHVFYSHKSGRRYLISSGDDFYFVSVLPDYWVFCISFQS